MKKAVDILLVLPLGVWSLFYHKNSLLDLGDNDESTDRRVERPLVSSSSFFPAAVE